MAHNKVHCLRMLFMLLFVVASSGDNESDILLKFKESLSDDAGALSDWKPNNNSSIILCHGIRSFWSGLVCVNSKLYGLRLENMSLKGNIDIDTLLGLQNLRSLSFMNNSFEGPMPNVKKLPLKALYFSLNRFSGEIPDDAFDGMNSLKKLYLARNEFSGTVPVSLVKLSRLMELSIEGNRFQGKIPNFGARDWVVFNVSDNQLEGRIPRSLSNRNPSSFLGNKDLCRKPLGPCKSMWKHYIIIIGILAIAVVALGAIGAFLFIRGRRAQPSEFGKDNDSKADNKFGAYDVVWKEAQSGEHPKKGENGKLNFVRNDTERFDLEDLLRASAMVLGSGSFGSSYEAILLTGPSMVVKRFRQMNNAGKEEFHDHMRRLGRLSHPNLLPLVAFYYKKEEKLLISDFVENGSLANHLHARRPPNHPGLDWPTRLMIVKGVARGLGYLYKEFPNLTLPHGHLKSSNVLLDHTFRPLLAEYALVPVINKEHVLQFMAAYKSPDLTQFDRATKKTDVWCLGILILELLTGKFPANYLKHGKGANADLATWVNSVVREEWTGEVFDMDMRGTKNSEEEMLKLLKIGMCCCEWNVERRWELREAVEKIEELKEINEDDYYSSSASEGDIYSSRGMTEEDFSFLG